MGQAYDQGAGKVNVCGPPLLLGGLFTNMYSLGVVVLLAPALNA